MEVTHKFLGVFMRCHASPEAEYPFAPSIDTPLGHFPGLENISHHTESYPGNLT